MFAILIEYTAALDEIDAALAEHVAWLDEHYASGLFLASGRREPRTGGVVLAGPVDRAQIDAVVAGDPFARRGLATHTVVEFRPSRRHEALSSGALRDLFT